MNRIRKKQTIFLIAAILWMAVIFIFSSRPAPVSAEDSSRVGMLILSIVKPGFRELPLEEQQAMVAEIAHPVRKTAHATEYAVLAMLLFGAFYAGELLFKPWLAAVIYAVTDEIHQIFVPGRSCQVGDICIDGAGALLGLLLLMLVRRRLLTGGGNSKTMS